MFQCRWLYWCATTPPRFVCAGIPLALLRPVEVFMSKAATSADAKREAINDSVRRLRVEVEAIDGAIALGRYDVADRYAGAACGWATKLRGQLGGDPA